MLIITIKNVMQQLFQSYELIQTEDIPNLDHARFSPQVVKDIAQNILSFLKSNATKEGHTYWLFKGISLSVLRSLCMEMTSLLL
jgi:hypothetical protein